MNKQEVVYTYKIYTFKNVFRGNRESVRKRATAWVLYDTFKLLKGINSSNLK